MKIRLQPYDPRLPGVKYPMKWGTGWFFKEGDTGTLVYENSKFLYVNTGFDGATVLWRRMLKPSKYEGAQLRKLRKEKGVGSVRKLVNRVLSGAMA